MTEARLQKKIQEAIKRQFPEAYVHKNHGGQYSQGLPDLEGCVEGLHFGLEVKMPGRERTVTKLQRAKLDEIKRAGGIQAVVTDVNGAIIALVKGLKAHGIKG